MICLLRSHFGFYPILCAFQVDANWLMLSSIFSLILKLSWQVYNYQDCPFSLFKKMSTSFTLFQSTGTFFILLSSQKIIASSYVITPANSLSTLQSMSSGPADLPKAGFSKYFLTILFPILVCANSLLSQIGIALVTGSLLIFPLHLRTESLIFPQSLSWTSFPIFEVLGEIFSL